MLRITILTFLLHLISTLPLQGVWMLQTLHETNVSMRANFSYYVFRNQSIMGKLQVEGCELLSYQFNVQDDNIYIDTANELVRPVRECTQDQSIISDNVKEAIREVLKFTINFDRLTLMDPSYDPIFGFQRFKNNSYESWQENISGAWVVNVVGDGQNSYGMIANETVLSICSGAIFNYKIAKLYRISASLQSLGACKDQNIINNVQKIAFYRKFDQKLELYDGDINLLFSAVFNPNGNTVIPTAATSNSVSPPSTPAVFSPATGFASGRYFLLLLYNRSLGRIAVAVTGKTITLQLCSQLVFIYNLLDSEKITIKSESKATVNCSKGNETLYVSSLQQSSRYKIDQDGTITLIDGNSRSIISLAQ